MQLLGTAYGGVGEYRLVDSTTTAARAVSRVYVLVPVDEWKLEKVILTPFAYFISVSWCGAWRGSFSIQSVTHALGLHIGSTQNATGL